MSPDEIVDELRTLDVEGLEDAQVSVNGQKLGDLAIGFDGAHDEQHILADVSARSHRNFANPGLSRENLFPNRSERTCGGRTIEEFLVLDTDELESRELHGFSEGGIHIDDSAVRPDEGHGIMGAVHDSRQDGMFGLLEGDALGHRVEG